MTKDLDGSSLFSGSGWDIGAYEYLQSALRSIDLTDFSQLPDLQKLVTAHVELARKTEELTWADTEGNSFVFGELVDNGDFEADAPAAAPTGWTASGSVLAVQAAGKTEQGVKVTNSGAVWGSAYQDITVESGKKYELRWAFKNGDASYGYIQARVASPEATIEEKTLTFSDSQWHRDYLRFTVPAGVTSVRIRLRNVNENNVYNYWDEISVIKVSDLPHFDGEVHKVTLDGDELDEEFTIAACDANADSFFYDDLRKRLYVHTTDSDSPAALDAGDPKYSCIAYFWVILSNRPKTFERFDDVILNGGMEYWASSSNLDEWTESISGTSTIAREATEVYGDESAYSCKITADGSNSSVYVQQIVTLRPGRKVKIRLKHKESASGKTIKVVICDSGNNVWLDSGGSWGTAGTEYLPITNATSFTEFEFDFIAHPDYSSYKIIIGRLSLTSASAYIEDVEVLRYRRAAPCLPFLPAGAMPKITQSIGEFHQPDEQIQFGSIRSINARWFWDRRDDSPTRPGYLWHNKVIRQKVGVSFASYDELIDVGVGRTRDPVYGKEVEIGILDDRVMLNNIPINRYGAGNVEESWQGRPKPILLGKVRKILPPCIDTTTYVYQFSDISFNGTAYNCLGVLNVYKDDVLQTLTTHYAVNLAAGTFTMVADPAGAKITCDCSGLDLTLFSVANEDYMIFTWIYFLYVNLCQRSKYDLDLKSLKDMSDDRLQFCGHWVEWEMTPNDVMVKWKQTGIIHAYPTLSGKHRFKYYTSTVPDGTPHFRNPDYLEELKIEEDTEQCFKEIVCRGQYYPADYEYRYEESTTVDRAGWEHGNKQSMTVDTILDTQLQTQELRDNYKEMYKKPVKILTTRLPAKALTLNPADKAYFSYTQTDSLGNEIPILDEDVFTILSLEKDLNDCTVRVRAMKDEADFFWLFQ